MLKNVVGAPVRGPDLFGRETFIDLIWNKLKVTNVLLAAPRRFGKTSIMYHLYDYPRDNFRVVHLDLERIQEPVNFIIEIKSFLNWFRNFRQAPDMTITNCAFLLGSSIGLDQYLANRNISAVMNDLERIQLEAFASQQAKAFLNELCKWENLKLSPRSRNKMLELIGPPIPYFIQVFFSELLKTSRIRGKKITPTVVEDVYFEDILGVNSKGYFIHYYEQLHHYSKNHERLAKVFLKQLCTSETLPKKHLQNLYEKEMQRFNLDEFNLLISNLENDYYIKFNAAEESYYFASNILKDWWRRYYGL